MPELTPEFIYLREILTTAIHHGSARLAQEISIDWILWSEAIRFHGVVPFALGELSDSLSKVIPPEIYSRLSTYHRELMMRSLFVCKEAGRLHEAFVAEGIDYAYYKGPISAEQAYGDCLKRDYSDLDVIVEHHKCGLAAQLLIDAGFSAKPLSGQELSVKDFEDRAFLTAVHSHPFIDRRTGMELDLHWRFGFGIDETHTLSALSDSIQSRELLGKPIRCVSPELQFVLGCIAATDGLWRRLIWCVDVANFLSRNVLDYDKCLVLMNRFGAVRHVQFGIVLAKRLFNLPDAQTAFLDKCDKSFQSTAERIAAQQPFNLQLNSFQKGLTHWRVLCFHRAFAINKLQVLTAVTTMLTAPDAHFVIRHRFPPRMYFLYSFCRPALLAWEFVKRRTTGKTR